MPEVIIWTISLVNSIIFMCPISSLMDEQFQTTIVLKARPILCLIYWTMVHKFTWEFKTPTSWTMVHKSTWEFKIPTSFAQFSIKHSQEWPYVQLGKGFTFPSLAWTLFPSWYVDSENLSYPRTLIFLVFNYLPFLYRHHRHQCCHCHSYCCHYNPIRIMLDSWWNTQKSSSAWSTMSIGYSFPKLLEILYSFSDWYKC